MSKLINELITILSATTEFMKVEQAQAESKLRMADHYDKTNMSMAAKLRSEAFQHQEKAQTYYETVQLLSDRIYGEKEVSRLGIELKDSKGNDIKKDVKTEVTTEIKDKKIAAVAKEIKEGDELEYPVDDAAIAVFNAFNEHADKEIGMENAMKKVEYFFGDEIEKRSQHDKETRDNKIASNPNNEEICTKAEEMYQAKVAKHTRLIAKEMIRKGQLEVVRKLKIEVLEEANPAKSITVKSPQEILKLQYWKDNSFNYEVFEGASEDKTEDLIKLEAIHKHLMGKEEDANALIRTYYKDLNWDYLKAQQFIFALLNEENAHVHAKTMAKGFVLNGLKANTNKGKKKGIDQAKKALKAWFRTNDTDANGKPIYMVDDKKLNKILDEVIAEAKAEVGQSAA